jgi:hypothetical membrane protein
VEHAIDKSGGYGQPARAPLHTAERAALAIAAMACIGFGALGLATGSPSVPGYVGVVVLVAAGIWTLRRDPLPVWLAIALAVAVVVHLAGGLVNVGHDVLYNASIGPFSHSLQTHVLQYDHFAHAYASLVGTLTLWVLFAPAATAVGRRAALTLVALAALGIGGLNEMIEFISTLAHHGAHVGGYANTGWDLVCNCIGVSIGIALLASAPAVERRRVGARVRPRPAMSVRQWALVASASTTTVTAVVLAASRSGYSSSTDTVSLLGAPGTPYASLFRVLVVVFGCSAVLAADAVSRHAHARARGIATLVAIYGTGTALTGVVPKNPALGPHAAENLTHVAAAVGAGAALAVAMLVVARWGRTAWARRASALAFTITIVGALAFRLTWGSTVYGVVQRTLLATALVWLVALAVGGSRARAQALAGV